MKRGYLFVLICLTCSCTYKQYVEQESTSNHFVFEASGDGPNEANYEFRTFPKQLSSDSVNQVNFIFKISRDFRSKNQEFALSIGRVDEIEFKTPPTILTRGDLAQNRLLDNKLDRKYAYFNQMDSLIQGVIHFKSKRAAYINPKIHTKAQARANLASLYRHGAKSIIFGLLFIGAIVLNGLYMLGLGVQNRSRDFYWYFIYSVLIVIHYAIQFDGIIGFRVFFGNHPEVYYLLNDVTMYIFYIAYIVFIKHFLSISEYDQGLNKLLDFQIGFHLCCAIGIFSFGLITKDFPFMRDYLSMLWAVPFFISLYAIYRIWRYNPLKVKVYVILGTFCLTVFSLVELLISLQSDTYFHELNNPTIGGLFSLNFTTFGILLELLCFSLGLGHKYKEKDQVIQEAQKNYIDELQKNQAISKQLNNQLNQLVEEKINELRDKDAKLAQEKADKMQAEFNRVLLQSELDAIKSQFNPHFIFNCLNSIKFLMRTDQASKAIVYLNSFAKLIRYSLDNVSREWVSLQDDLNFLKQYVDLENLRLKHEVDLKINQDLTTAIDQIYVPPMLLQPLIENAIWHGVSTVPHAGVISINLKQEKEQLRVTIEDNGKGIAPETGKVKTSGKGIKIVEDRLRSLENRMQVKTSFKIESRENEGTKVHLIYPVSSRS